MSVIIKGGISGNLADVDSNNNLKVNLTTVLSGSGYATLVSEVDTGTVTGTRLLRQLDSSQDYRLRTGIDKIVWQDTFSHAVLNNSKYIGVTSTMTITVASGFLNLNAGSATASGNVARVQTFKSFSIFNTYPLFFDAKIKFSNTFQTNSVIEFGFGYATTTTAPTDGVFFRVVGGALQGVINYNGGETTASLSFTPTIGVVYKFAMNITQDKVEFYINGILYGSIPTPSGQGAPCLSNSLPLLLRQYNNGVAGGAITTSIAQLSITQYDMDTTKDWATTMVTNGQSAISAPDGQAAAQSANYANSAAPASATLSNTTAGYTTLGGQWQFAAVAGAETDYALFAYTNPAGTAAIPAKTLVITGVRIDSFNTVVAVATTPTLLQWSIGVGGTAASLATVDSVTAGTRKARTIPLGTQTMVVGTPAGGMADKTIDVKFTTPLMVEAGTVCHIILKMPVATATATEVIRGTCLINGYFE
jgi:hypothetical protein